MELSRKNHSDVFTRLVTFVQLHYRHSRAWRIGIHHWLHRQAPGSAYGPVHVQLIELCGSGFCVLYFEELLGFDMHRRYDHEKILHGSGVHCILQPLSKLATVACRSHGLWGNSLGGCGPYCSEDVSDSDPEGIDMG